MKLSLNKLISIIILTLIFSECYGGLFLLKPSIYSFENSQSDKGLSSEADSPFCFDTDSNEILYLHQDSNSKPDRISADHLFLRELFGLSTYSLSIWQPPKID
jgi:hypothetical protein